jgi:hypothetical protein
VRRTLVIDDRFMSLASIALVIAMHAALPAQIENMLPALRADAAQRLRIDAARLSIVSIEDVTWPDGALGCGRSGEAATMALVPGWRIVLAAPEQPAQHYHASRSGAWLWCPAQRSRAPAGGVQRL